MPAPALETLTPAPRTPSLTGALVGFVASTLGLVGLMILMVSL
jgi:hypothetical protein